MLLRQLFLDEAVFRRLGRGIRLACLRRKGGWRSPTPDESAPRYRLLRGRSVIPEFCMPARVLGYSAVGEYSRNKLRTNPRTAEGRSGSKEALKLLEQSRLY